MLPSGRPRPGSTPGEPKGAAPSRWRPRPDLVEAYGTTKEIVTVLAPRVRTVTDGEEIFPGVRVRITVGHTHGHAEYAITSGTQRLIAFGDALHSPIQVDHPEWSCVYDHVPVRSADHRPSPQGRR